MHGAECCAHPSEQGDEMVRELYLPQHRRLLLYMAQEGGRARVKLLFSLKGNLRVKIGSQADLVPCGWRISSVGHLGGGWVEEHLGQESEF